MNEVKEQGEQEVNEGLTEANLKRSVTWNSCFQTKWSHVTYWANLTSRSFCNHLSALTRSCKIYTSFQWTSEGFFNTTLTAPVLLSMLQSGMIFDSVTIQLLILSLLLLSTVKKIKRMLSFSSRKLWFHTPISPNIKTGDVNNTEHLLGNLSSCHADLTSICATLLVTCTISETVSVLLLLLFFFQV